MSEQSWEVIEELLDLSAKTLVIAPEFDFSIKVLNKVKNLHLYSPLRSEQLKFKDVATSIYSEFPTEMFDQVLFVPTKNKVESLAYISLGMQHLHPQGSFVFSCANDEGAKSYMTHLKTLSPNLEFESKRKTRFALLKKAEIKMEALKDWTQTFEYQKCETGFVSFPGIYGWNKIDHASKLLLSTLPKLSGVGADFGSGYGYLGSQIDFSTISHLHLLENDVRALECSKRNLAHQKKCSFHWLDIAKDELKLPKLDFILMNPPFHEGKNVDTDLGKSFIRKAFECLKKEGHLYLVANQFLPYEDLLMSSFGRMEKVLKADGFKVIHV